MLAYIANKRKKAQKHSGNEYSVIFFMYYETPALTISNIWYKRGAKIHMLTHITRSKNGYIFSVINFTFYKDIK